MKKDKKFLKRKPFKILLENNLNKIKLLLKWKRNNREL